jgi:SAM-dependent methyltransferase
MPAETHQETSNVEKYERPGGVERRLIERFRAALVREVGALSPRRVLDAGCGEGIVAAWLSVALPDAEITGVDARPEAIAEASRRTPSLRAEIGDLYALPFGDGEFDLVLAIEVLEHLDRPRAALRELARVSARSLILTVPHEPFFRAGNLARGRYLRRLGSTPGHVNTWTRRGFLELVDGELDAPRWWSAFPWQAVTGGVRPT